MNSLSKLVALAFLGAGTALISPAASQAQTERQANPIGPGSACCTPASRRLVTNASWTVQPPSGPAHAAVPLNGNPSYIGALSGSQWIGNAANDGKLPGEAGTQFTYTYHFCLCGLPEGIKPPVQATMSLDVYSDNEFTAYLNGTGPAHKIGFSNSPGVFLGQPTHVGPVAANLFVAGTNTLTIVVTNQPNTPTGLDVSGYISGYFQEGPCPQGPPYK